MASREHQVQTCKRKVRFPTRKKAVKARNLLKKQKGQRFEVYPCSIDGSPHYHLATDRSKATAKDGTVYSESWQYISLPLRGEAELTSGRHGFRVLGRRSVLWVPDVTLRDLKQVNSHAYFWCRSSMIEHLGLGQYVDRINKTIT